MIRRAPFDGVRHRPQNANAPILLVSGMTLNPQADFGYGWEPALRVMGWPFCTVDLPGNAMGDIQIAGEYVVYAIRTMVASSGRRVEIVGHSQEGWCRGGRFAFGPTPARWSMT